MKVLVYNSWRFLQKKKRTYLVILGRLYVYGLLVFLGYHTGSYFLDQDYPLYEIIGSIPLLLVAELTVRLVFYSRFTIDIRPFVLLIPKRSIARYILATLILNSVNLILPALAIGFFQKSGFLTICIALTYAISLTVINALLSFHLRELGLNRKTAILMVLYGVLLVVLFYFPEWIVEHVGLLYLALVASTCLFTYVTCWNIQADLSRFLYKSDGWSVRISHRKNLMFHLDGLLVIRNRRPREHTLLNLLLISVIFFPQLFQPGNNAPELTLFFAIMCTGVFLLSWWQFFWAWDSAYYRLISCQFPQRKLVFARLKFLLAVSTVLVAVQSITLAFINASAIKFLIVGYLFNIGVMTYVLLYFSFLNNKRIELDRSVFFNFQGSKSIQVFLIFGVVGLFLLIYKSVKFYFNIEYSLLIISIIPVIGILSRNYLIKIITNKIFNNRHYLINGYSND